MSEKHSKIIKLNGKTQDFDAKKIENSIKKSCLAVNSSLGEADKYAKLISQQVNRWLKNKAEVTSLDLRNRSTKELQKYHPDAAEFYENYKKTI